jgi:DNA adenine methylase
MSSAPTRPAFRYHGGKWTLAPWLLQHFPAHDYYVEPFGGAGSVLLRKEPARRVDVYNDIEESVVNLFRVLRDPEQAKRLRELCEATPFARVEFEAAREYAPDPVERARRLLVRTYMGFGATASVRNKTGFRSRDNCNGAHAARSWPTWPEHISEFTERLKGVVIECRPAADVIAAHDTPSTLFYCDPPYVLSTRTPRFGRKVVRRHGRNRDGDYSHEMTDDDHRALAEQLHGVQGMVLVSGYACQLYDEELYPDWIRRKRPHVANGGSRRTEVLWLNPAAAMALQPSLFTHESEV